MCLAKLLKLKPNSFTLNGITEFNKLLCTYNLFNFTQRLFIRLSTFLYKIIHENNSPSNLKKCFIRNFTLTKHHDLRNKNEFLLPSIGKNNNYLKDSFQYFFPKFANILLLDDLKLSSITFEARIRNNSNSLVQEMIKDFNKFNLEYNDYNF